MQKKISNDELFFKENGYLIKKIKDVKSQEEVELKGWTEDIEKIKVRLAEVDAGIFNQI